MADRDRLTVAALYVDPNGVYANLPGVTWLYYYGDEEPPPMLWGPGPPGEISSRGGRRGHGPTVSTHNNHHKRSRTPPAFRDVLLAMARSASVRAAA